MHSTHTRYRESLPQIDGGIFLTDGGMETTLVFQEGIELPEFAAFDLLKDKAGEAWLWAYYERYLAIAEHFGFGFVLESATWRANPDWGRAIGYDLEQLAGFNRKAIDLLLGLREARGEKIEMVVSGCVGPRGDGYDPARGMSADEAANYHAWQIAVLDGAGVDMVSAITMTNVPEAVGIARAALEREVPCVISFTVETDGRLPTGQSLAEAIEEVDSQTDAGPAYYMINCAHPTHFETTLDGGGEWVKRIRALRANASKCSHAELDNATELDDGNPAELGEDHVRLLTAFSHIHVLGGCCGTDHRHVEAIAMACADWSRRATLPHREIQMGSAG